jgi:hypothetical protein
VTADSGFQGFNRQGRQDLAALAILAVRNPDPSRCPSFALVLGMLALVWALAGCGDGAGPPSRSCEVRGCPAGSTCVDSACLADAPGDYRVAVQFVPPAGEAVAEWKHAEPRLISEIGDDLAFAFHDRVLVRGTVSRGGVALPSYVELERASAVPHRAPTIVAHAVRAGESFELAVPHLPEVVYHLQASSVDPQDPFPPVHRDLTEADLAVRQEVLLPEIVIVMGTPLSWSGQRMENLLALAVDPATGEAISSPARTSELGRDPATGAPTGGEFRLSVPATTEAFAIRLSESDLTEARGLPTIQFSELLLPGLSVDPTDGTRVIPLAVLVYPRVNLVTLSGTVEGRPRAGGRVPLDRATLRFWSEDLGAPGVADAAGTIERLARSEGALGEYRVGLLPAGTYRVEITPPAQNELADLAIGVVSQFVNAPELGDQSGIVLEAPPRFAVGGTVVDADGRPLEGARVELRGGGDRADVAAARAEIWVRSASAVTTAEGAFLALVDPGHYDVVVEPPADARLPWAIRLDLPVTEDTSLPEPIVASPGRRLSGVANDDAGAAPGVTVEVWCLTETDASIVCGRTTTDAAGRYELLLPPSFD